MKYDKFFKLIEKKDHIINKIPNLSEEQKEEIIAFFNKHPNYESELGTRWNKPEELTWEDFEYIMHKERVSRNQLPKFVKEGTHYIILAKDKNYILFQPLTWFGAQYLASKYVAPGVEGKWCISYQKDNRYWWQYSFDKKKVFIILCTPTTKYALEISQKGVINYWDSEDQQITKAEFVKRIKSEIPNITDILKEYVSVAVQNRTLVVNQIERDLSDIKSIEELQKKTKELEIKNFDRNFQRELKSKGYYTFNGDLTIDVLKNYGLIYDNLTRLDEKVKYFKVLGNVDLNNSRIKVLNETNLPMYIEGNLTCKNNRYLEYLKIPEGTYTITNEAFSQCRSLTNVEIPESVTNIGAFAFESCISLKEINLPKNLVSLDEGTFDNCLSLKEIVIPEGITKIPFYCFNNNEELSKVVLPSNLKSIAAKAFFSCDNLKEIQIPESVTLIGNSAFEYCREMKSVKFLGESKVSSIGASAFGHCISLTDIKLPNNLKNLGAQAFAYSNSLKTIQIPNGVETLESATFYHCDYLEDIFIPNSVKTIRPDVFIRCINLETIFIDNKKGAIPTEITHLDHHETWGAPRAKIYWNKTK